MATANPYDPKNRSISKTIYYSHQTGANEGDSISASPFPTPYGTDAPSVVETCTIDCSHNDFDYNQEVNVNLNDVTNDGQVQIAIGQTGNRSSDATEAATALAAAINNGLYGTWITASASANAGTLTITNHSAAFKVRLRIDGAVKTAPVSGGTPDDTSDHRVYAVTASAPNDKLFAEQLAVGGSSYTVQVLQGA